MSEYILIVEDSQVQRAQLEQNLLAEGFNVKSAENGKIALELIKENPPALIISDIIMPIMDGYEFCTKVKSDKNFNDIPIILLTSLSDPKDVIRGILSGADCFLTKPCSKQLLLSHIERVQHNLHYRKNLKPGTVTHYWYQGKPFDINISEEQLMTLLLSTYENAVYKNGQLEKTKEQLLKKDSELKKSNSELESWLNDKQKILAIAAHDIVNPIAAIISYIELLLDNEIHTFSPEIKKILSCIRSSSQYMLNLITELLDLSKIVKGTFELTVFKVDPVDLIEELILLYKIIAFEREISLQFKPSFIKTSLYLDADRFKQALSNLIANSIKFSPPKSEVTIECHAEANQYIISIKDHGPGIDEKTKMELLQPFENLNFNKEKDSQSLSFAIANKIINAHKGKLSIDSENGKGTTITVSLPLIRSSS